MVGTGELAARVEEESDPPSAFDCSSFTALVLSADESLSEESLSEELDSESLLDEDSSFLNLDCLSGQTHSLDFDCFVKAYHYSN